MAAAPRVALGEVVSLADSDVEAHSPRGPGCVAGAVPVPLPSFLSKQPSAWASPANGSRSLQPAGAHPNNSNPAQQFNSPPVLDLTQVKLSVAGESTTRVMEGGVLHHLPNS